MDTTINMTFSDLSSTNGVLSDFRVVASQRKETCSKKGDTSTGVRYYECCKVCTVSGNM